MSRSVAWRRTISDAASWHQDQALNATIYILRENGPIGFLLKEEGETKKYKVLLGDPHSCTCQVFRKEKDLCKHICWVLLKKFRVPRTNPVTWQLGLVEREITAILKGHTQHQQSGTANARTPTQQVNQPNNESDSNGVKQREIAPDDVCPICQEELLAKRLPVTFCRNGCGNNVHIKCMKVWAEHQKSQGAQVIKCPMCREDFGSLTALQTEHRNSTLREVRVHNAGEHLGTTCYKCDMCPIVGKCYRCLTCSSFLLCQACFNTPTHTQHQFEFREKANQRWRPAHRSQGHVLPEAMVQNLMSRDIGEQDYELLLQLDNNTQQPLSDLTEETIRSFPLERVRSNGVLLQPGQQCRICLRPYQEGQFARKLLCNHKFHRDCIDNWLLHQHATCPIDGTVFTNESVLRYKQAQRLRQQQASTGTEDRSNLQRFPSDVGPTVVGQGLRHTASASQQLGGVLEVSGLGSQSQPLRQRHTTQPPLELPEPYIYTASGDYITFPATSDVSDLSIIERAAAARHRSGSDHGSAQSHTTASDAPAARNADISGRLQALNVQSQSAPNSPNVHQSHVRANMTSSIRTHAPVRNNTLDFSNLLMTDVQRQRHSGRATIAHSDVMTRGDARADSGRSTNHSTRSAEQLQNTGINLTIGSITEEVDHIMRSTRTAQHTGVSPAGRAALMRRQMATNQLSDTTQQAPAVDTRLPNVSGQRYHMNGDGTSKPPSGKGRAQAGKLRSKALYKDPHRPSSGDEPRSTHTSGTANTNNLFIGNDPATSAAMSHVTGHEQLSANQVTAKLKRGRGASMTSSVQPQHQWGATQTLTSGEMMLSGSACK